VPRLLWIDFPGVGDDGNAYFYLPRLSRVVIFSFLFFLPFFAPIVAMRRRKLALFLFLPLAAVATLAFGLSPWSWPLLRGLALVTALFVVFGGLWLGTDMLGWPPLTARMPRSAIRRLVTVCAAFLLFVSLDIVATFAISALPTTGFNVDCRERPPFDQPLSSRQAVFTARLIRVGHSRRESGTWTGGWAIGRVQERFWGLGSSAPRFVLLMGTIFLEGQTYFVDGTQASGLLTRFLPIVDTGPYGCSRTQPVDYAALEMHILHQAKPTKGPRILGYARKYQPFNPWTPPMSDLPVAGAQVSLTGSEGTTTVNTDQDGFYEVDGLPPDNYTIKLALPDSQVARDGVVKKGRMIQDALIEQNFTVFWNGIVEGKVIDPNGAPAHVWVLLQHTDGNDLGPYVRNFLDSDKNGSFRIEKIPPGSYKLTINPNGPSDQSPYAPVYYPSGKRSEDAGVLDVAAGQYVKDLTFVLRALPERTVQARVTWPDGKAADGAWVYVAYEHTSAYGSLHNTIGNGIAGHDGVADLHVFGDSHIRVFAEVVVDDNTVRGSARYSVPVELDITKLPAQLNLVVSAPSLPHSP
jgi:Carboxypeptidase regulatory-like domain